MTESAAKPPLSILFGTGSLYREGSGPTVIAQGLTRALGAAGHRVIVAGTKDRWGQDATQFDERLEVHAFRKLGPYALHYAPGVDRWLRRLPEPVDVAILQGPWVHANYRLSVWARRRRVPYLVTPHGTLTPVALKLARLRKRLMLWWYGGKVLRHAACFHASSAPEYEHIRALGLRQPVAVVPNGVELPQAVPPDGGGKLQAIHERLGPAKVCLYLGRVHPIKGLDLLLRAWGGLGPVRLGWKLVLAGPDEGGHTAQLQALCKELGLGGDILFAGPQYGADKDAWLRAAHCFVLPSRSEGFPMAPLEAMAYRLPILLSDACRFPQAQQAGAGLVVPCSEESVRTGLQHLLGLSDIERRCMAMNGYDLVRQRYSWESAAAQTVGVCRWLLGQAPRPACVIVD